MCRCVWGYTMMWYSFHCVTMILQSSAPRTAFFTNRTSRGLQRPSGSWSSASRHLIILINRDKTYKVTDAHRYKQMLCFKNINTLKQNKTKIDGQMTDLWWDDGEVWKQSRRELSEICDICSHWDAQVNKEDLHYFAGICDCDLTTQTHFHMNVCDIVIISTLSSQQSGSDSLLTSTLAHFPLYWAKQTFPLKGLDTKNGNFSWRWKIVNTQYPNSVIGHMNRMNMLYLGAKDGFSFL